MSLLNDFHLWAHRCIHITIYLLKVPLLLLQLEMKPNPLGDPIAPKQQDSYKFSEVQALAGPPFILVKILCWSRFLGPNPKDL